MIIISLHGLIIVNSHIKKPLNFLIGYFFYICGGRVLLSIGWVNLSYSSVKACIGGINSSDRDSYSNGGREAADVMLSVLA